MYRSDGHGGLDPILTPPDNGGTEYHCPNPNCGAVTGNKLDLCVGDHSTAVQYGVWQATVYFGGRK